MNISKSIAEKVKLIKSKNISAVDLINDSIQNLKNNKSLNILVTDTFERAKKMAKIIDSSKSDTKKSLLGIPFTLKDVYVTKDIKTTASSKILRNYIPPYNATVYQKIIDQGGILIGKTNCDAWGHGASTENSYFGPTRNPFDTFRVAGGSSGGSAVSVAAQGGAFDIAEDTGGSIRLPSAFCGVVGLKPTYGRVSRYGVIAFSSSLDTVGPIAKTVEDCAYVLETLSGNDPLDATSLPGKVPNYTKFLSKSIKGKKIGVLRDFFTKELDPEILENINKAIAQFKSMGVVFVDISIPHIMKAISAYYVIAPAEASSNLARYDGIRYGSKREDFGLEAKRRIVVGTFSLSSGYYDAYYKKAQKIRELFKDSHLDIFKSVDAYISPVSMSLPFKVGEKFQDPVKMYLSDVCTVVANLTGIPAISIPSGFSKSGLPLAFQLSGPPLSESTLLNLGYIYEQNRK